MDIVGYLPPEVAQHILLYLGPNDIDTVWNHISEWRHLCDSSFWKRVCRRIGYQDKEYCLSSDIYKTHMLQCSDHWQAIYKYYRLIDFNWRHGKFKQISLAEEKKYDHINYFDDEILIVSDISFPIDTIDIINLSTGKIHFSFNEEKSVRKSARHQNLLIFLVYTNLKVLNLETNSWILNLRVEEELVFTKETRLNISNNLLTFVNSRHCLHVVNLETKKLYYKTSGVADVSFGDKIIVLILKNSNNVKVLDWNCKTLMSINYDGKPPIEAVLTKGGYVIIFYQELRSRDLGKICVYTVQQDTKSLQEITSVRASYQMMCFPDDNTILFWNHKGNRRSTYKLWKFATENHTTAFSSNKGELELAASNNNYMFILKQDYILDMWCSKTGQFIKIVNANVLNTSSTSFEVTEKKLVYLKSDGTICVQNHDIIEVSANNQIENK